MKPESLKHSLRRHHSERKKMWVRRTLRRYFTYETHFPERRMGLYARTPKVCSCYLCGNPRRHQGEPTLQERRSLLDMDDFWRNSILLYPNRLKAFLGKKCNHAAPGRHHP